MIDSGATALSERDATAAANLRLRFGFLRDVVGEMQRSAPYAAEAMAHARFSSETAEFGEFAGPAAIRFESLQVAGAD